jgi:DNA topoisomerase-1
MKKCFSYPEGDRPNHTDILSDLILPSRLPLREANTGKKLKTRISQAEHLCPIIATLNERKYITREKKMLKPTELGFIVTDLMETYFKEIVDAGFTATLKRN